MQRPIGRVTPLYDERNSLVFLPMMAEFRWTVGGNTITGFGYVADHLVEIEFERFLPDTPGVLERRARLPQLPINSTSRTTTDIDGASVRPISIGTSGLVQPIVTFYSGFRVRMHFPPTIYRGPVDEERQFSFNKYAEGVPDICLCVSLGHTKLFHWTTQRLAILGGEMNELALSRDLNLWLISLIT